MVFENNNVVKNNLKNMIRASRKVYYIVCLKKILSLTKEAAYRLSLDQKKVYDKFLGGKQNIIQSSNKRKVLSCQRLEYIK